MPSPEHPTNHQEWIALHTSYEHAERVSLLIKLIAVLLTAVLTAIDTHTCITCLFIGILWLQDAIWKTFQSRTEQRLLTIEKIASTNQYTPPAFYSEWEKSRPSLFKLIQAYVSNAFRPTIAYPYPILIIVATLTPYIR